MGYCPEDLELTHCLEASCSQPQYHSVWREEVTNFYKGLSPVSNSLTLFTCTTHFVEPTLSSSVRSPLTLCRLRYGAEIFIIVFTMNRGINYWVAYKGNIHEENWLHTIVLTWCKQMLIGILQQSKDFPAPFEQANRMTSWFLLLVLSFAKEAEFLQ